MVREIEFEFREDGQGGGQFLASGNVVSTLRDHVNSGRIPEAAKLFASCTENVGDELLHDFLVGASQKALVSLADMFAAARDYGRAAQCAERAGDFERAARMFEQSYDVARAAEYYLRAQNPHKAAELYERNLDFAKAGEIWLSIKDYLRAAESLERAGSFLDAGKLFIKMARLDKAAEALQRVEPESRERPVASLLLGQIYERSNKHDHAARLYLAVARTRPCDASTVELYFRLGCIFAARGHADNASKVFQRITAFDPRYKDVGERLRALGSGQVAPVQPLDLTSAEKPPERMIGVDPDFEFLRGLPLFSEMSLDELKAIQTQTEKARFAPGQALIEQGRPGEALFILTRGKVKVTAKDAKGGEVVLVELGAGANLGEMSLIDDAPTSATVRAVEDTVAFKLPRERFFELLATNEHIALRFFRAFVGDLVKRLRETNKKLQSASK